LKGIESKAKSGYPELRGLGEEDLTSLLEEFTLVPSSVGQNIDSGLDMEMIIGEGRDVKFPLLYSHPIFVDSCHIGKVNKSVRIALAYGALLENVPINVGYGLYPEEEKVAGKFNEKFIMQWTPQRLGNDIETLSKAKAIVINLSVPSHGRMYTLDEFLDVVDEKGGLIAAETFGHQPHLDLVTASDLKQHVDLLREATDYSFPIMIKIPCENIYGTTKAALASDCDAVIVDTSVNPYSTLSIQNGDYGTSTVSSIPPAKKAFKEVKAQKKGIKLLVTGGFRNGADVLKMIALGADGVGISESAAVALGCNLCGDCYELQCEKGIVTRNEALKTKFKWKSAGKKLANFVSATKLEMEVLMDYMGVGSVKDVNEKNVIALTYDSAAISGVKLVGYDRELPMWFH
jgi:glutamate synthase domain-containing protein 2